MPKSSTLFMETTMIQPSKTCGEIIDLLVKAGASQVHMQYDRQTLSGLRWCFKDASGREQLFAMPVRVDPIREKLKKERRLPSSDPMKPDRVAWRQLLRWVEAQVAMIECGMSRGEETFMAYAYDPALNKTLFQVWTERKALAAPENGSGR